MRSFIKSIWPVVGLLILTSCSHDQPAAPAGPSADSHGKSEDQYVINGYLVQYDGRTVEGEQTTFAYTVAGTGEDLPDLTQFRLQLPACAGEPASYSPAGGRIFTDEDTGLDFIKWPVTIASDDLEGMAFTLSYPGDVAEGLILSGVKSASVIEYAEVPGAGCASEDFTIAGAVYVDVDGDGVRDAGELGIAQVAVELVGANESVSVQITDADGAFSFDAAAGDYTLRIDVEAYPESFNAELAASFDATTPLEIAVSVGPDSDGNEFGFSPATEEIIDDLEGGDLTSTGEDRIFWKQQIRWAMEDAESSNVVHDREELLGFIAEIQELYLDEIFQFTPGNELQEVFWILRNNPHPDIDELKQQLLITELNEVSGRGLVNNPELQDVLIAWGEAVWVDNQEAALRAGGLDTGGTGAADVSLATPDLIPPAIDVFTLINTGGGGGVDE